MEKTWDVTITKVGSIEIVANSEEEAMEMVQNFEISGKIVWEDGWNAVDVVNANE